MINICKAKIEDSKMVAELFYNMWSGSDINDLQTELLAKITANESEIFIAYNDNTPVGVAQCGLRKDYVECTGSTPVGYLEGFYGFPKGHIEVNESEQETALREIYEEIGIRSRILAGFRTTDEHPIPNKKDVIKRMIYFVAEYDNQQLCYQEEELEGAYLMTYEEAMNAFQFESSKRILNEAKEFIE